MSAAVFYVGDAVVYRPYPGGPAEDGVVTGFNADCSLVFVRYRDQHPGAAGKATPLSMLEHLTHCGHMDPDGCGCDR